MKVELGPKQVLEFIILGIRNGNYQAAINLAQDSIDQIEINTKDFVQKSNEEKEKEN